MRFSDLVHHDRAIGKHFGPGILALALVATVAYPQSHFTAPLKAIAITGTVTDQTGAPLPGAMVILKSTEGLTLQTKTDRDGRFKEETRPGEYTLNISLPGFKILSEPISLATTTNLTRHLALSVGMCGPCFTVEPSIELETQSNPFPSTLLLKPLPLLKLHPRIPKNHPQ